MIFKNLVLTSEKTQLISITKIKWLILFREIIALYTKHHTKQLNTLCGQNAELLIMKAGGT
jgi:hypothetical protein